MAYQKKFTKPFPGGYRDFPDESTIITASVMDNYDQTLEDFDTEFETVDGKLEKLKGVDNLKSAFKFDESGNPVGVEVTGDVVANGVSLVETKEAVSANETNITKINSSLTNVENRVTSVEKKATDNAGEIARVDGRVDELKEDLSNNEEQSNDRFDNFIIAGIDKICIKKYEFGYLDLTTGNITHSKVPTEWAITHDDKFILLTSDSVKVTIPNGYKIRGVIYNEDKSYNNYFDFIKSSGVTSRLANKKGKYIRYAVCNNDRTTLTENELITLNSSIIFEMNYQLSEEIKTLKDMNSQLEFDISVVESSKLDKIFKFEKIESEEISGILGTGGQTYPGSKHIEINVNGGEVFSINGYSWSSPSVYPACFSINSDGTSTILVDTTIESKEYIDEQVVIPSNGIKLVVNAGASIAHPTASKRVSVELDTYIAEKSNGHTSLYGKKIANFGDSIFGNKRPPNDVSTALAEITGATVYNLGFGGCRMANHNANWDAFSMYRLADSIATGDFTVQDSVDISASGLPSYFSETRTLLESIDWDSVDIITIAYGTNDFTASIILDSESNEYDTTTFAGALRHSIETLLGAYPHLKIFVCGQTYRFWMTDGVFVEDSDTKVINNAKLTDFVEKTKEVSKQYHLKFIDNYYDLGINKFNRTHWFPSTDGTHHNQLGAVLIAQHIANEMF